MISDPSHRSLMFFGYGQLSRSVLWCTTDMLIAHHLIERVGFSGRVAGLILSVTFALSAMPDLFVARWLARRPNPADSALRLQYRSGVIAALTAVLLFVPPPAAWHGKIAFVCAASIAFRIAYAVYDVSQNTLITLLPRTAGEMRKYVTGKTLASSIGRLFASLLIAWALSARSAPFADMDVMALIALPVILTCAGLARTRVDEGAAMAIGNDFRWSSLPLVRLAAPVAAMAFQVGGLGLTSRLLPLYGRGEAGYAGGPALVMAMVCGTVAGPILTHAYDDGAHDRRTRLVSILAAATALTSIALLVPHAVWLSLSLAFVYGAALSGITNLIWERAARVVVEQAIVAGRRIDAPAFALLTTAIKLALAASNVPFGLAVDGFRAGALSSLLVIAAVVAFGGVGTAVALALPAGPLPNAQRRTRRLSGAETCRSPSNRRLSR